MTKKLFLLSTVLLIGMTIVAAVPHRVIIPNIEGYLTLKGDMHMHTVFSDASVWPTTRVEEAAMEGLDVLAITDHVDSRLQKNLNSGLFNCDRDKSYELAKSAGKTHDVLIIHGGEITRGMPPGHWNTLFVDDNDAIVEATEKHDDDFKAAQAGLNEAKKQGAFSVWNHPHWERQAQNETKWYPEHTQLYNEGHMQGIEIYNSACGYSPEAHRWAMERNLTLISGTDSHKPMFLEVDFMNGQLRPMTLIFAKERTLESVHEALKERRTAVFTDGKVYGRENVLNPLFKALLQVSDIKYSEKKVTFKVINNSSIPLTLSKAPGSEKIVFPRDMIIRPFEEVTITIYGLDNKLPIGLDQFDMNLRVENFFVDVNTPMIYSLHFEMPGK